MQIRNFSQGKSVVNQNSKSSKELAKSLEKLSSGYQINRAGDDASGLAVSEKMKCSLTETGRVINNVTEGISVTRVADGALQEVSDMIIRAEELTIQAANGTYTQVERDAIAAEIRELYAEMDRIFDSTTWNTINIFKLESYEIIASEEDVVWNYDDYVFTEELESLDYVGVLPNSELDWVEAKDFDVPEEAENSTVTMELDSYFFENPEEMVGKTFTAGSVTYTVSSADITSGTVNGEISIEEVLKATISRTVASSTVSATSKYLDPDCVEVSEDGTVVLGFQLNTYEQTVVIDGSPLTYPTKDGEGDSAVSGLNANNTTVSSENAYDFESVDLFATYPFSYPSTATANSAVTMLSGYADSDYLTTTQMNDLLRNSFRIGSSSDTFSLGDVVTEDMTVGEIRQAIFVKVNQIATSTGRYTVEGDASSFSLTANGLSTNTDSTSYYIQEITNSEIDYKYSEKVAVTPATVTTTSSTSATPESNATATYAVDLSGDPPYNVIINGTEYNFIPASVYAADTSLTDGGYSLTSHGLSNCITIADDATAQDIIEKIAQLANNSNGISAEATPDGQIKITSSYAMTELASDLLKNGSSGKSYQQTYRKTDSTSQVLGVSTTYYTRSMELGFNFSDLVGDDGLFDPSLLSDLDNVAFSVGSYTYYLQGSSSADYEPSIDTSVTGTTYYKKIDISNVTSFDQLASLIKSSVTSPTSSSVDVDATTGKITLNYNSVTVGSSNSASDTISSKLGLFTGYDDESGDPDFTSGDPEVEGDIGSTQYATSEGGTLIGNPLTELDFSQYNASNFADLLGKGFTINCASCEHEKNTFIFVNDASELGELTQGEHVGENGEIYDVNTYALEMSKLDLTDAESFVASIAAVYNGILSEHTLEFVVDPENPTVLVIQDKRVGMVTDRLPSIEAGVYGDYAYNVEKDPVDSSLDDPFYGLGWETPTDYEEYWYGGLKIFVDSDMKGDDQYIIIRLPYLDAITLDIEPPKPILNAISDAMEENAKLKELGIKISEYRGNIGADYNRLQYAYGAFTTSEIYETDSMSTIRDTDIALEMLKYTKENILLQSQQAMLSHVMESKNQLLQLLE